MEGSLGIILGGGVDEGAMVEGTSETMGRHSEGAITIRTRSSRRNFPYDKHFTMK